MSFRLSVLVLLVLAVPGRAAVLSNLIVDQFGWRTGSAKVAILAQPQSGLGSPSAFTPGAGFEIRRSSDNAVVFSNTVTAWNGGATHAQSQDKGWWADFSALSTPGSYYLSVPGGSNPGAQSYAFDLREDIFSAALAASVKSYYYQRCGTAITAPYGGAWTHALCHNGQATAHLYDGSDQGAGTARDIRGGWHDAGDYRKYVSFTYSVLWDLLQAYEWNPCAFGDASGIPESGNGVPDILDEVKWELDWLLKMQIASGGNAGALYSGAFVVTGGGGSGDPSAESATYYYANYSSGATGTGAMAFAKAARLFQSYGAAYPGYASTLQNAAVAAWTWLQAHPTNVTYNHTNFQNANANVSADDDLRIRIGAAAALFRLTGGAAYQTYFDTNYNSAAAATNSGTYQPVTYGEFWPEAAMNLQMACVDYCQAAGATAPVVTTIKAALKAGADNRVIADQNAGTDLYRGYMWDGYYGWGSNQRKSHWGALAVWAQKLGVGTAPQQAAYLRAGEEYLHYIHGRNPLNQCYLSNMGPEGANAGAEKSCNQIYNGWFWDGSNYDGFAGGHIGPAPGILAGGANQFYATDTANSSGTAAYPPAGQPMMKSFLDWNTNWPDCSWSVTENGIYYQAAYTFLVAMMAPCSGPQPTATPTATPTSYAGTPTFTPTASATPTPSASPSPVCQSLLNGAETLAENGTWSGPLALRSLVASGSAPAGAVTQGSNALYVNITVTAGWDDGFANLAGFSPAGWGAYSELRMDVHVAAGLLAGSTYAEILLRADCASCGAGLWYQPISADQPALVAGAQTLSWALDFSEGTIPAGSPLSKLTLVLNNNATSATGAIYIDNVRLIGSCVPSPTPTPTRTRTATASATRTPSPTATQTASPSSSPGPSQTSTLTLTPPPTPSRTATASFSASPTFSVSPTETSYAGSPTDTETARPSATATPSFSSTTTATLTPSPTWSFSVTSSPTLSWTPLPGSATATASPGVPPPASPSETPSRTATRTQTLSPSPTPNPAFTATATPSVTLTPSPTPTSAAGAPTPAGVDGSLEILQASAWPQPNPSRLSVLLSGPTEQLRLRLYTPAWVCVGQWQGGPYVGGWNQLSPADLFPKDASPGLYYVELRAQRGAALSPSVVRRIYCLR